MELSLSPKKIRQSNVLIEATYAQEFTALEFKLFEVGLAEFCIDDLELFNQKNDKVCSFSRAFLAKIFGINPSVISQEAHRISSSLMAKFIEIKNILDDGTIEFKQIGIAPYCEYINGNFEIHWNYRLIPFLLEIKNNFTEFYLKYLFTLNSAYAMKLYKLLYQYKNIKTRAFLIDDLKKQFGLSEKYTQYKDFKKRVLDPSILQINMHTDLSAEYSEIKIGRKVQKLEFKFQIKKDIPNVTEPLQNTNKCFIEVETLLSNKCNDVSDKTKSILSNLILTKSIAFVECSINYAKKNAKTNFEKYLLDTINNNWVEIETQKLESKRQAEEIERQKKQAELDLANKQLELENTNKSEIEHLFLKLADSEQIKYSSLANNILNKNAAKLQYVTVESLSYSIFAVSNGKYYDRKSEVYISKFLKHSLNINDYKINY